jgi:hypothetical protein
VGEAQLPEEGGGQLPTHPLRKASRSSFLTLVYVLGKAHVDRRRDPCHRLETPSLKAHKHSRYVNSEIPDGTLSQFQSVKGASKPDVSHVAGARHL